MTTSTFLGGVMGSLDIGLRRCTRLMQQRARALTGRDRNVIFIEAGDVLHCSASCRAKALGVLLGVHFSHLDQALVAQGALVRGGDNHRIIPVCVRHAASRVPAAGR